MKKNNKFICNICKNEMINDPDIPHIKVCLKCDEKDKSQEDLKKFKSLKKGIKDIREGRIKDLGSFAKYAKEEEISYFKNLEEALQDIDDCVNNNKTPSRIRVVEYEIDKEKRCLKM